MVASRSRRSRSHPDGTNDQMDLTIWSAVVPYLPGALVDTVRRCPERKPPWIDPVEGSLALADISGFTPIAERLAQAGKEGAEWLTDIMNRYFTKMLDIGHCYGCCDTSIAGDALLLMFKGSDHGSRAVAAAAGMQRATARFSAFRAGEDRVRLRMTAAVHSGVFWSAIAGLPDLRMQHLILGSEASRLARLEATAKPGELLITPATLEQVGELCLTEPGLDGYRVLRLSKRIPIETSPKGENALSALSCLEVIAYVPPAVARGLQAGGSAEPTAGEHRKVTVIFINLVGTNELLEDQGSDAVLAELQQYLAAVLQSARQYGGFLVDNDIDGIGLKLMLVFGAPVAHEQDSANACRFGLELCHELAHLGLHFRHRIGIHSGFVFAADLGGVQARKYTMVGDAVNLTARLASSSALGQILVSDQAMAEAGLGFVSEELTPIRVKGKTDLVRVCLLKGERRFAAATPTVSTSPLVGREAELKSFRQACRETEDGKGRVVHVSGSAGIGKSRLIVEFEDYVRGRGWRVCKGNCYSHTSGKPFGVWIQVLNDFFDVASELSPEVRTEKAMGVIRKLRPDLTEVAPLLNPLLSLDLPGAQALGTLDDEARRRRLFDVIAGLLQQEAGLQPLALILEDLHYADGSSIQLINRIGADVSSFSLMLCLSCRPEKGIQLRLPPVATLSMPLTELPESAALQLVRTMLNQPTLSPRVQEVILSKARGNPLFLEQVSASIRHSGVLERVLNAPAFKVNQEMASINVPDQIHTLIMSRIDALGNDTKEALRGAAVIGNTFDLATLRHVLGPGQRARLRQRVQDLTRFDLTVQEDGPRPSAYRFKHALIQEVAYDSLSFAQRRGLHCKVGAYIERTNAEQIEAQYEVLVHHYSHGGDRDKTRYYSIKAAEKARRVFSHDEAIAYYRHGLDTVRSKDRFGLSLRSYVLECVGDCYDFSGRHEEASSALRQALRYWHGVLRRTAADETTPPDLTLTYDPRVREATLCHKLAVSCERSSDYDSALRWLELAQKALPLRHPLEAARIEVTRSLSLYRKGLYQEAVQHGRRGLALARRSADLRQIAYARNILASSYLELGSMRQAVHHRRSAIVLYERLGDLPGLAQTNNNLGACYQLLGELDRALRHYQATLKISKRMANPTAVGICHNNIGEVLLTQGRLDESIKHFKKMLETYERTGDPLTAAGLACVNLSRAYQRKRCYQSAAEYLQRAILALRKSGARPVLAEAHVQQAELQMETGHRNAALQTCSRALNETRELGTRVLEAHALRTLGLIQFERGQCEMAETTLKESIALAKRIRADYERGLALLALATVYGRDRSDRRSYRRCQRLLQSSTALFRKMGAEADLSRAVQLRMDLKC